MTKLEELKQEFIGIAKKNIKRDGLDNLLAYLDSTDFYRAPASTRYHGSYAGGLVSHSIEVYHSLVSEMQFIYGPDWEKRYSLETITIVSLFHDLCKIGRYKSGTRNVKDATTGEWVEKVVYEYNPDYITMGHGAKSVIIIMDFMALSESEKSAIYWHMGPYDLGTYNSVGDLGKSWNRNTLGFALFRADLLTTYIVENEQFEPIEYEISKSEEANS
jgi:hypothetical protein